MDNNCFYCGNIVEYFGEYCSKECSKAHKNIKEIHFAWNNSKIFGDFADTMDTLQIEIAKILQK